MEEAGLAHLKKLSYQTNHNFQYTIKYNCVDVQS